MGDDGWDGSPTDPPTQAPTAPASRPLHNNPLYIYIHTLTRTTGQARLPGDPLDGCAQVLRHALPPLRRVAWCAFFLLICIMYNCMSGGRFGRMETIRPSPKPTPPLLSLTTLPPPPPPPPQTRTQTHTPPTTTPTTNTNTQGRTPPTSTSTTPPPPNAPSRRCPTRCLRWRR